MRRALMLLAIGLLFVVANGQHSQAADVSGTAPTVSSSGHDTEINAILADAFNIAIDDASDNLAKFKRMENLAKGFGNANVYSSQVATLQGYQNYLHCAVTVGAMVGVQLPSLDPDYYNDLEDVIDKDGDIYAGVGAGISFINLGFNASSLHPGLYMNVKFGTLSLKPQEDVEIKNTVFGVGANYCLVKGVGEGQKLFKWRGLSLGTGLLYHSSKVDFKIEQDEIAEDLVGLDPYYPGTNAQLLLDPSFNLGLDVKTTTIPVDISTSVQLLWLFNLNLGAGVDFNFGSSDIVLSSKGGVRVEGLPDTVSQTAGKVRVNGSTLGISPSSACGRIMTGIGFNFSMVKIDVPVIWYPSKGASVGVTAGVVW
ncbi:MAG TPA: hypothetical protein VGB16_01040 [candidate division Zixibacteria bacterium]